MQQLFESIISFSRNKVFKNGGKIAVVATMLFVCGFFINTASAATSGPNFAGSGTNVAGIGTYAWTVPANIVSNNNVYATVDLPGGGTATSNYVAGRSYGFAIPTNATINGIQVVVGRYTSGTSDPLIRDHVVSLVKGGVITGDNKAVTGTNWPTTEGAATYGSVSDLWGTSWTPADINSANFGVDLSAINTNATPARNRTASVDYIQVIVTYTVDTVAPVIAPHSTVTATADALGSGHVIYTAPAVTDNVDATGTAVCLPASGSVFAIGNTTVTCNATDVAGNHATSTTFTVTVNRGPISASQSTLTRNNPGVVTTDGGTATYTITAKDAFGNVLAGQVVSISAAPSTGASYDPLTVTTDVNGQAIIRLQSTKAEDKIVSVTIGGILIDQTESVSFTAGAARNGTISASTVSPEASLTPGTTVTLTITVTDAAGNQVQDNTPVAILASAGGIIGGSGNTVGGLVTRTLTFINKGSVTLSFSGLTAHGDVIINFIDTTKPEIVAHADVSGIEATSFAGATVTYDTPLATDNIDGAVSVSCLPVSSSTFALGNTTVTCTASDSASNIQTSTFVVSVIDTTKPVITAPIDVTNEATGPFTIVSLGSPIVSDIADASPVISNDAPAAGFAPGETTVTWTATDGSGNFATATQIVTILDTTSPVIDVHADITGVEASIDPTLGAGVGFTAPMSHDLVDGDLISSCLPASGSTFYLGTTTVTCSKTDAHGNVATSTTFNVVVVDTTKPAFSATAPATDAFIKADYTVSYTLSEALASGSISVNGPVSAVYTLSGSELTIGAHTISQASLTAAGISLAEGVYAVTFDGTDMSGNAGTLTSTGITYDVTPATVVNVTSDKADGDYKAGENIVVSVEFSEPVNVGTYYRPWGCGYWGDHCWDTIDQRPYLILETGATDRTADYSTGTGSTIVSFSYTVQSGDNSLDLDTIAGDALNLDGQSIRDFAGNDSNLTLPVPSETNSLSFNKNIKIDAVAPVIASHAEVVAEATSITGAIVDYVSPEAVDVFDGTTTVACLPVSGSQFALGDTTVTCTSADALGNTATSNFNVHVHDTTAPAITAPADVTGFVANGVLSTVSIGSPITSDVVDAAPVITNDAPVAGFPVGTTVVTWTSTDFSGNFATATQNIIVVPAPISKVTVVATSPVDTNTASIVTVTGRDQWDHPTTNQSGTIVLVSADNGAALGDTILTLVNGVAETTLRKTTAGNVNITVSSGNLLPGTAVATFTQADVTAPYVVTMSPANGATNVAISAPIFFNFSEALNTDTVNADNIKLMMVGVDSTDTQVAGKVLAEGNQKVYFIPDANLDYSVAYYFIISGVSDKVGNVMIANIGSTNSGFTTTENTADLVAPIVAGQSPLADATGVALNARPYVDFSEAMKATTLTAANIELRKASDNSVVPASISVENGGTRAVINPLANLDLETSYYIYVSSNVADEAGNLMGASYTAGSFTTIADDTVLAVTGISTVKSFATADGSWANGWAWQFDVTAPTAETGLRMRFADFVSGANLIPAASNIRFYSAQSNDVNSGESAIVISEANTYSGSMNLTGDLDTTKLGRQIRIIVEVRVPEGTVGGSYSTSYGIQTVPNEE